MQEYHEMSVTLVRVKDKLQAVKQLREAYPLLSLNDCIKITNNLPHTLEYESYFQDKDIVERRFSQFKIEWVPEADRLNRIYLREHHAKREALEERNLVARAWYKTLSKADQEKVDAMIEYKMQETRQEVFAAPAYGGPAPFPYDRWNGK